MYYIIQYLTFNGMFGVHKRIGFSAESGKNIPFEGKLYFFCGYTKRSDSFFSLHFLIDEFLKIQTSRLYVLLNTILFYFNLLWCIQKTGQAPIIFHYTYFIFVYFI